MRIFRKGPPPLTGVPLVRRMKFYSAQSGYVYQYFYLGWRALAEPNAPATEFVFDVAADRKSFQPVSVIVPAASIQPWEAAHGRTLASNEIHAIAKLALFQAFDERPEPSAMAAPVHVRPADADSILEQLGV